MLFSSQEFLFVFLPLTLLGYLAAARVGNRRASLTWLVLCSLAFYGWWKPLYLLLLAPSVVVNFGLGVRLAKPEVAARKATLIAGIALNLGLLSYFKYANFFVETAGFLSGHAWRLDPIVLPIGISFFTFQQIAYLVDTYRSETHEYHFVDYALFVTFFPQLIAGPIVHHKDVMPQFDRPYQARPSDLSVGLAIFAFGLAKKVLLADSVAVYANPVFDTADAGGAVSASAAWVGMLAYTLQLYFDLSGYSDMAIGLARLFGIKLPLNFDSPYKATSVVDFWRRWHKTLSRFLRDYLYFPLGGNRKGRVRRYVNLMTTMLLGGLWHGAGWNFVLWGFVHGALLCVNHAWEQVRRKLGWEPRAATRWGRVLACGLTFLAVAIAWVPFRAKTWAGSEAVLSALVGHTPLSGGAPKGAWPWLIGLSLIVFLAPNTQQIFAAHEPALDADADPAAGAWSLYRFSWTPSPRWAFVVALLTVASILGVSRASEFLYYQF